MEKANKPTKTTSKTVPQDRENSELTLHQAVSFFDWREQLERVGLPAHHAIGVKFPSSVLAGLE